MILLQPLWDDHEWRDLDASESKLLVKIHFREACLFEIKKMLPVISGSVKPG